MRHHSRTVPRGAVCTHTALPAVYLAKVSFGRGSELMEDRLQRLRRWALCRLVGLGVRCVWGLEMLCAVALQVGWVAGRVRSWGIGGAGVGEWRLRVGQLIGVDSLSGTDPVGFILGRCGHQTPI